MNWLFPVFLAGAAAVLLPLLLHFLRRRPTQPQPFPALRFFLNASPADQRRHRLRRWLVLLLRCGAIALLAMMFARPYFRRNGAVSSRATVIVVDNSFSLQATGRWERLHKWAGDALGRTQPGESVGILLTSPRPAWLVAPTRDVEAARRALGQFQPGWQASRFGPALAFAADALEKSPAAAKRIIFVGDHQAAGWNPQDFAKPLPAGISLAFPPVAPPVTTQAALGPPTITREGDTVTVQVPVRHFSGNRRRTLNVFVGYYLRPAATAAADPGAAAVSVSFKVNADDTWLRCTLDPDDLPADDEAWALIPVPAGPRAQAVLLDRLPSAAGADYLATAYEALAQMPDAPRTSFLPAAEWPAAAVAVLRHDASFTGEAAARLDAFLAQGGRALVFLTGGPAQAAWLAARKAAVTPVAEPRVRDWSIEHPLVTPLAERGLRSLVGWQFTRGWSLPANVVEPLAFWSDGSPALGELSVGKGRVLLAGFSPDRRDGEWPVETAFVPFLHRAALHLLKAPARIAEVRHQVGTPIPLPEGAGNWQRLSESKRASDTAFRQVSGQVVPDAPGVFEWVPTNGPRRLFAVQLAPEESDLAPWSDGLPWLNLAGGELPPRQLVQQASAMVARQAEQQGRLWWWCLAAAAVFLLAELAIANRTSR